MWQNEEGHTGRKHHASVLPGPQIRGQCPRDRDRFGDGKQIGTDSLRKDDLSWFIEKVATESGAVIIVVESQDQLMVCVGQQ